MAHDNGTLMKNCSWSGTTICNTGYNGEDRSDISFIGRMEKFIGEGYFEKNKIDTLFLFGGTNDSWADSPIGEPMYDNWTKEDLYNVLPGFSYLINLLIKNLPETKIYCIINTELKEEITSFYKDVCKKNKISVIELYDIEKIWGHPTIKGMSSIARQITEYIEAE